MPPRALPRRRMRTDWRDPLRAIAKSLFHPAAGIVAVIALGLGIVLPPQGVTPPTCTMLISTGTPCPSCGLTRSVSSVYQGEFVAAWQLNPFGFGFALLFGALAPFAFVPGKWRRAMRRWAGRRGVPVAIGLLLFLFAMFGFGLYRAMMVHAGHEGYGWWKSDTLPPAFAERAAQGSSGEAE